MLGATTAPSRSPPVTSVAPAATASLDRPLDAHRLRLRDDRAEPRLLVERVAGAQPLDERRQPLDELAVHLAGHEHALDRDADLPGVDVAARRRSRRRPVEIGVGKHDQRAVRAELEREALDAGDARDLLPDRGRAREADLAHPRVGAQHAARARSPSPVRHWIAFSGSPASSSFRVRKSAGQRCLAGGLEHDRVARRERGPDLVRRRAARDS